MTQETETRVAEQIGKLRPAVCRWCKHLDFSPGAEREDVTAQGARCRGGIGCSALDDGHLCRWFHDVRKDKP